MKRVISVLLCAMMLLCEVSLTHAEEFPYVAFATVNLRLRRAPGADASVLTVIKAGEAVIVSGATGEYYIAAYEGQQGYALKSYLTAESAKEYKELKNGSRGDDVIKLQTRLAELDYYRLNIDGKYGEKTAESVLAFQKMNGLPETGNADAKTQEVLYSIYAAAYSEKKPEEPKTEPEMAVFPFATVTTAAVNLRTGLGTDTKRLTTIPKGRDILVLAMKGDYLEVTYASITGFFPARYAVVPEAYIRSVDPIENNGGYTVLAVGDSGSLVRTLQRALAELNFYKSSADGEFGSKTRQSVLSFQKKNGLDETGVADSETQTLLYEGKPRNASGYRTDVKTLSPIHTGRLQSGDIGTAVTELQRKLNTLGFYTGDFTDTFDKATVQAVKNFQKSMKLTVDGIAGEKTLAMLQKMLDAANATPEATLPAPPVTATPAPTELTEENIIEIHNGTRGVQVRRLQERLVELGYYACVPDGIYDADDIQAVRLFQQMNNLKVDGIAGLQTQIVLYSDAAVRADQEAATPTPAAVTATPEPTPAATPIPYVKTLLKRGSVGEEVKALQSRLITLGYLTSPIDGMYGRVTEKAVREFQQENGLTNDGQAGEKTLQRIYAADAKPKPTPTPTPTPSPVPTPTPTRVPTAKPTASPTNVPAAATQRPGSAATAAPETAGITLSRGSRGNNVTTMQERLNELGYTVVTDGIFGSRTQNAVIAFQKRNGLTSDGIAGSKTLTRLYSQNAKAAQNTASSPAATPTPAFVTAAPTATPVPQSYVQGFSAPKAADVRYANWYTEIRARAKAMPDVTIYDPDTGLHYELHMFSFGKHADSETPTAEDTAIMNQVCGLNNWTAKAVWVIFSDGRVYLASTHSHGHEVDHTSGNNLDGHICLHFPRLMEEAEQTGPYAVSHQNAILREWERIQLLLQ